MAESELYGPVRRYLESNGYEVHAEVKGCDITAVKGEKLIVVELKSALNFRLLVQAAERQRLTDSVYVAIPRPKSGMRNKKWRQSVHLLRRLEIGLIVVSAESASSLVQIIHHPIPLERKKSGKGKRAIIREIDGRSGSYNTGGVSKTSIMTAYRENCIHVACCLEKYGPSSPAALRKLGTGPRTQGILYNNHYGWFERVGKGLYALHNAGRTALKSYEEIARVYRDQLDPQRD